MGAFATGVPPDINAFHRYTGNSPILFCTQAPQYETHFPGWARGFHIPLTRPPARPLRPVIPNNVCSPRITAAAGTELAGASFSGTVKQMDCLPTCISSRSTGLYNLTAFIAHAASLGQGFPHCRSLSTAASRRSLGRISVPVWLTLLSDQLPLVSLVARSPANHLIA